MAHDNTVDVLFHRVIVGFDLLRASDDWADDPDNTVPAACANAVAVGQKVVGAVD